MAEELKICPICGGSMEPGRNMCNRCFLIKADKNNSGEDEKSESRPQTTKHEFITEKTKIEPENTVFQPDFELPFVLNQIDAVENKLASKTKRIVNYIIDTMIINFAVFMFILMLVDSADAGLTFLLITAFPITFILLYYIIFEYLFQQTPGKFISQTKVVNTDGFKPVLSTIIIRSFCRLIPFEAFSFLGTTDYGWHDMLSKTRVVDINKL